MALFNPDEHKDESFIVPEGPYQLYMSSQEIKYGKDSGVPYIAAVMTFVDGPRQGKGFDHIFAIFNPDEDKRKKAETWFGNFCRAVGLGPFDPETEGDKMLNKVFLGDVVVDENPGYQPKNKLLPWGFHKIDGTSNSPKATKDAVPFDPKAHEDDIPF
jgi:hypothetical protein